MFIFWYHIFGSLQKSQRRIGILLNSGAHNSIYQQPMPENWYVVRRNKRT